MTIDSNGRAHAPEGTPAGGRFTATRRAESDTSLDVAAPHFGGTGYSVHQWRLADQLEHIKRDYRAGLLALDDTADGLMDWYVTRITDDSHLARGVPGKVRVADARTWLAIADADTSDRGQEFASGFRDGVIALMSSKLEDPSDGNATRDELAEAALTAAVTKRASAPDRAAWAERVQWSATAGGQRGYLVAAAVLAGEDTTWGFRDHINETIHGRADW
ncbi:hypothetical protein [Curtobacterium sp. MCBD17_040]|uniref:hypothetical protein n=1 Tax=Curtobacterium sp. MCBD17_040 TaxID=2175674 RepID=UPI0011B55CE4|nr:hypothetical protein [Curtobacterium sp. MCBD17_040]WIB65651.1 hypothetical protein DEI94_16150 [Curtobacterium sp. MCBD17_040]